MAEDLRKSYDNDWNLGWFKPRGFQIDTVEKFEKNTFTIVDGPSGCGKTTTALWWALCQLREGKCNQIVFIKNPSEVGDSQIGYLSGSESDKLMAHMDTTRRIFWEFMSKGKLKNDEANDKIRLTIPNFLLGTTFDDAIVIMDETQIKSPNTVKLVLERCGKRTKYIILGDSSQRYSVKRVEDGFKDLIARTTANHQGILISKCEPMIGYMKLTRHDNQRSEGSKYINKLYEED